jgi:hypothetical protein
MKGTEYFRIWHMIQSLNMVQYFFAKNDDTW